MTNPPPKCKATSKSTGEPCKSWPMRGQVVCHKHGGNAPQARKAAQRRLQTAKAAKAVSAYGLPREVEPHTALLEEVHRTAGHVATLSLIVGDLEQDQLTAGTTKTVLLPDGGERVEITAAFSVWVALYQSERKHLVHVCRTAIECGVTERVVRLEEQRGALMADMIRRVLGDPAIGLSEGQRETAMVTAARHLRLLAAGEGEP